MSSECEKLIDWIMSYFDPHWESLGPEKRDEILVKAKQLFQAAIDERVRELLPNACPLSLHYEKEASRER